MGSSFKVTLVNLFTNRYIGSFQFQYDQRQFVFGIIKWGALWRCKGYQLHTSEFMMICGLGTAKFCSIFVKRGLNLEKLEKHCYITKWSRFLERSKVKSVWNRVQPVRLRDMKELQRLLTKFPISLTLAIRFRSWMKLHGLDHLSSMTWWQRRILIRN